MKKKVSTVLPFSKNMLEALGFDRDNPLDLPSENIISRRRVTKVHEGANTPYQVIVAIPTLDGIKEMYFECWAKPGITAEDLNNASFRWHWDDRSEDYDAGMVAHFITRNLDDEEIADDADED